MAGQLADTIERNLGVDVPITTILNYPTLEDLSAFLLRDQPANEQELIAQIAARFEEGHERA